MKTLTYTSKNIKIHENKDSIYFIKYIHTDGFVIFACDKLGENAKYVNKYTNKEFNKLFKFTGSWIDLPEPELNSKRIETILLKLVRKTDPFIRVKEIPKLLYKQFRTVGIEEIEIRDSIAIEYITSDIIEDKVEIEKCCLGKLNK